MSVATRSDAEEAEEADPNFSALGVAATVIWISGTACQTCEKTEVLVFVSHKGEKDGFGLFNVVVQEVIT